ncbi:MAG: vitamin B12 dependent-methionine synthase activation domain-containing protein [Clostridia bacterium]|nr:vitamin B12 dependent-methionine synthase activation domain-containing protein [Clostridia bacterium]
MPEIIYRAVPADELPINENEVARRLGTERGYTDEMIESCRRELLKVITPKFSYTISDAVYSDDNVIDLGYVKIKSETLNKNLQHSPVVYTFAATVGHGVDRLLMRLSKISQAKYFVTDALASAYAEALADYANNYIKQGKNCRPRFSPGFGDVPLSFQKDILGAVNAQKLLGITLTESFLMSPMKSVTAFIGEQK